MNPKSTICSLPAHRHTQNCTLNAASKTLPSIIVTNIVISHWPDHFIHLSLHNILTTISPREQIHNGNNVFIFLTNMSIDVSGRLCIAELGCNWKQLRKRLYYFIYFYLHIKLQSVHPSATLSPHISSLTWNLGQFRSGKSQKKMKVLMQILI